MTSRAWEGRDSWTVHGQTYYHPAPHHCLDGWLEPTEAVPCLACRPWLVRPEHRPWETWHEDERTRP